MAAPGLVMIAVDGSSQAENAFEYYIAHLHKDGNSVLMVHAAEPGVHVWWKTEMITEEVWDHLLESDVHKIREIEEKFNKLLEKFRVEGRFMALLSTNPGASICKVAQNEQCSMIVIGARGLGRIRRTILGSVSTFVVHHAHCPVAICRQPGSGYCNVCGPKSANIALSAGYQHLS